MIMPYASYVVSNVLWNLDKLIPEAVINADIMIPTLFIRILLMDIINVYNIVALKGKKENNSIFAVDVSHQNNIVDLSFYYYQPDKHRRYLANLCKRRRWKRKKKQKVCFVKSSTSLSHIE